jgi:hypothetical protein
MIMKKLLPVLIVFAFIGCNKKSAVPSEVPVSKKIEYHIFAAKDYSAPIYANVKTGVTLQIRRIDYKTGDMELLWDTSFVTRNIVDFPQYVNKIVIQKFYPVFESKEKLNGSVSVRYNDSGYISQEAWSDDVVPGEMFTLLEAHL